MSNIDEAAAQALPDSGFVFSRPEAALVVIDPPKRRLPEPKRGLRHLGNLCWSKRARPALGRRGNSAEPPGKIADLGAAAGDDRRQPVLDCLHLVIT